MCGICGVLMFDGNPVDSDNIRCMTDVLSHRGPDDEGVFVDGVIGLGHRRLSILDTSPAGHQPMSNHDRSVWISYNGEIYNYLELRAQLESRGHIFRTQTDTEVLVHGYEEWGKGCLEQLVGMFAFALWDRRRKVLWLVRDRLGIKPLFYAPMPDRILFASEIKGILADTSIPRDIDYAAMACFFASNWTPAPRTLFKSVCQILPGQYLEIEVDGTIRKTQYWELQSHQECSVSSELQATKQLDSLLSDAVRSQLVSDVPFGCFLSGGLDSSAVLYYMRCHMDEPPKAFTIGFGEFSYDETPHARMIANHLQAQHFTEMVQAQVADILPSLVWHAEEPTADSSMLPMYYLARMARHNVKMVLCGDGADEIMGGYDTYCASLLSRHYRAVPLWLREYAIAPLVRRLPVSDRKLSWEQKLKRFVAGAQEELPRAHGMWRMICDTALRARLLAPVWSDPETQTDVLDLYEEKFAASPFAETLDRLLWIDTRLYLPNDMLVKVDRMAMAHGLEARVPFLDHRLVEYCFSLSPQLKISRWGSKKYVLKQILKQKIPSQIINKKKSGFNIPVSRWINGDLREMVCDILAPNAVRSTGVLDDWVVSTMLHQHQKREMDYGHQIWGLMVFMLWWKCFQA